MVMTPEERAKYDAERTELESKGYVSLRDATKLLDMHDTYVRTLVRQGKIEHIRDSKNHIWIHTDVIQAKLTGVENRRERAQLRKEGKLPKYQYTYQPAKIQHLKGAIGAVDKSAFDADTKSNVTFVLTELLNAEIAAYEAAKAQKAEAAEEEAEE